MKTQNLLLILGVLTLTLFPLLTIAPRADGEAIFTGSDGQAEDLITHAHPDYQPWFAPLWEPPSNEIESMLFGLQASIGAALIGYCFGYFKGVRSKQPSDA